MRVEILTGSSRRRLEEMINERLRYYDPLEIIDIKFSGSAIIQHIVPMSILP